MIRAGPRSWARLRWGHSQEGEGWVLGEDRASTKVMPGRCHGWTLVEVKAWQAPGHG